MLSDPFTKWLWDARSSVLGWTIAIAAVGGMYAAFWPAIDDPQIREALQSYPEALMEALNFNDIATAAGYLNASVYGLIVAVLLVVYSISAGSRIIAGDEESGTLDLVLAHPVSRIRLALQRYASFLVSVVVMSLGLLVVMLALVVPARLEGISIGRFVAMHLHLVLFGAFFGAVTFAAGGATGRKMLAVGIGAAVAVFGFAASGVFPQVSGLEWTRRISPFHWLNGGVPLRNGLQLGDLALMTVLALVLVAVGTAAFDRRDVAV